MVVFTLPSVFMIMPMASFYQIDPDGDVDIVLLQPKEVVPYVDDVLDCPATSPRLNISRLGRQEPSEPEPLGEEPEWRLEPQPTAETEPAPVSEALDPDGYPGPATTPERQALAIVEDPSDVDQTRSVLAKEDASSTLRQNCVQIRVSSKHLVLASPYFKRNLGSGMLESHILSSQGHVEFRMDIEDLEAMLIVMNIVHGRTRQVPRHIDLDMLTRVAVLVDYLECHEVIELFSDRWIDDLKGGITTTYSEALIQWLCISLIFRKACQFKAVTHTAIRQTKGPIDTLGLPIRESVVDKINHQRFDALDRLLSALEDLLNDLRQERKFCNFECNAMRYGALAIGCRELLFPRPQIPFLGYSFENTVASVRKIREPNWCASERSKSGQSAFYPQYYEYEQHTCKLTSHITPIISSIDDNLKGLSLCDDL